MDTTITMKGAQPGKTLAIFCGVHGDETAGIQTVDFLRDNIVVERGTVHLVYANPVAMEQNVRFTEKNLNRCFVPESSRENTYEEKRAMELMALLDSCDALLDLHAYTEKNGESTPFAITEANAFAVVQKFDIGIVVTGIDAFEKGGTDGYMYNNGKIGICVELGAKGTPELFVPLGIKTAFQFLQYFDAIAPQYNNDQTDQTVMNVTGMHVRKNEAFEFAQPFKTFDFLTKGTKICTDGSEVVYAPEDLYILFPGSSNPIGVEAYLTATETKAQ